MRASFGGHRQYQNEAAPVLAEYLQRKRMASLGLTTNLSEIDTITVEAFCLIDQLIEQLREEKQSGR